MVSSDQEWAIQKAFRLAYSLHPNRAVALCVTIDGIDEARLLQAVEEKRPLSRKPFKLRTPAHAIPQVGIYMASELWEIDQESPSPQKEPAYKPTPEDMIVRYAKGLIYKAMNRAPRNMAIALGCFLYTYRPYQIKLLSPDYFDRDNIRRNKGDIKKAIQQRFAQFPPSQNKEIAFDMRKPSACESSLVEDSLHFYSPWVSAPPGKAVSLYETVFTREGAKSDWELNHILANPKHGGFSQLIREYNGFQKGDDNVILDDPKNKLAIPAFIEDGSGVDNRFNQPPLTPDELALLRYALNKNSERRARYSPAYLRICIDGHEILRSVTDEVFSRPVMISPMDSYIQVVGEDCEGDLLLAVFPVSDLETIENGQSRELSITHKGGQTVKCLIESSKNEAGEAEWRVRIAHTAATHAIQGFPPLTDKEAIVLGLLATGREMFGLEMVQKSEGQLQRGSVYVILRSLSDKGYVTSREEPLPDPNIDIPRRLYKITGLGQRALEAQPIEIQVFGQRPQEAR